MKKTKVLLACCFSIALLSGCEALKVTHYAAPQEELKKVTILSVMIDRIIQPPIPLIDAAIFNGKTNSISDEIITIQQSYVNEHRQILANSFMKHFDCNVIYADTLHNHPEYAKMMLKFNKPSGLYTGNDNFPIVAISSGDINPFNFYGKRIKKFFQDEMNYKEIIGKIGHELDTDYIIIAYSNLEVNRVDAFGFGGNIVLATTFHVFNEQGDLLSTAQNRSTSTYIGGKDPEQYAETFDSYPDLLEPMMQKLEAQYKAKQQ